MCCLIHYCDMKWLNARFGGPLREVLVQDLQHLPAKEYLLYIKKNTPSSIVVSVIQELATDLVVHDVISGQHVAIIRQQVLDLSR